MAEDYGKLFLAIGLKENTVKATLKNADVTQSLASVLKHAKVTACPEKKGALFYGVATKLTDSIKKWQNLLAEYVAADKIISAQRLDLALDYLKEHAGAELDVKDFDAKIGVGVVVTDAQVKEAVEKLAKEDLDHIKKERYCIDLGAYLAKLRERLPFAEGGVITKSWNDKITELLGPITEDDKKAKAAAPKKKPAEQKTEEKKGGEEDDDDELDGVDTKELLRRKIQELNARDLASAKNSPELLQKHKEFTGGKIITRFPPEPNGYLHIGHAKSIRFNFGVAQACGGHTYLRYDDTNPEKETQEYIINIEKNVRWLGYEPWKVTHASEYFETLYDMAVTLIKKDKAFICHQTGDEMHKDREARRDSPYRNRPIDESLRIFDEMRRGLWEEGKAVLRLKIDMKHENTNMRDPVAYRIRFTPHPHVGDKWCIYPMYDYTHCINDSLENITHSCCSLEFEIRRELYYWTLEQLNLYRPFVWEFSRLNISNTVLSKRKLQKLVFTGTVRGWDDPRILTLNGLRRRGYTPESINHFCDLVSITRRGNENIISLKLLEHCIRKDLDAKATRTMAVLDPIKLTFVNVADTYSHAIKAPNFPKDASKGTHDITLTKEVYVDRSDVKLKDVEDFFGIAPGKIVGLKYAFNFKVIEVKETNGEPSAVVAELLHEAKDAAKPKTYLHWLSTKEAIPATVNLYDVLFTTYDTNELGDNWFDSLNPNALVTKSDAVINKNLVGSKLEEKFQFERLGFFVVDPDSDVNGRYIFNRTIQLVDRERKKLEVKKTEK